MLAGVLPTPAVALLALDLGVVISASHNPPEYNGVKFFARNGRKLADASEEEIEALLDEPAGDGGGEVDRIEIATDSYLEHILDRFGSDLVGPAGSASTARTAPTPASRRTRSRSSAPRWSRSATIPTGRTSTWAAARPTSRRCRRSSASAALDLGVAFDGDGDRMLAVDHRGEVVDGDQIVAVLALDLDVDLVAVTVMTNLGLHTLMGEHGIRVLTTAVGDRYVLEALQREGGVLGGEQSGHIIYLRDHVTGDGLASALLLCAALDGADAGGARRRDDAVPAGEGEHPRHAARSPCPR